MISIRQRAKHSIRKVYQPIPKMGVKIGQHLTDEWSTSVNATFDFDHPIFATSSLPTASSQYRRSLALAFSSANRPCSSIQLRVASTAWRNNWMGNGRSVWGRFTTVRYTGDVWANKGCLGASNPAGPEQRARAGPCRRSATCLPRARRP